MVEGLESEVDAAARFADRFRRWREHRGLSKRALAERMAYDRTYLSHIEGRSFMPTEDFARRAEEVLDTGGALWSEWLAFSQTRSRYKRASSPVERRDLRTAPFIPWITQRSGLTFQQAYASVVSLAGELEGQPASIRHARDHALRQVTREVITDALSTYYDEPGSEVPGGFYSAAIGGEQLQLSILTHPGWIGAAVAVDNGAERSELVPRQPGPPPHLPDDAVDGALRRLAEVETTDTVLVDNPLYRLLSVDLDGDTLKASFTLSDFITYALSADLLEAELVGGLADMLDTGGDELPELPLRRRYLPTLAAGLNLQDRVCIGGTDALLAVARPATAQHDADYLLLVQERSGRVLNTTGKLAVIPKAFHQPTVDSELETSIGATLGRELEEELLGREDLEYISQVSQRQADPLHSGRASEPMQWLSAHESTHRYRCECLGFGINMVTGNYIFPALIVIDDEEWWQRFGHQVEANWETARMRRYSTLDTAGLTSLAADAQWANESLFAYLEALRHLAQVGDRQRLALPGIEVEA